MMLDIAERRELYSLVAVLVNERGKGSQRERKMNKNRKVVNRKVV